MLSYKMLKIMELLHFNKATPVQACCIPLFISHKDVAAYTGSGKTLAFLVPIFEVLSQNNRKWKKHDVGAVILVPTREIAFQILKITKTFSIILHSLLVTMLVGGISHDEAKLKLKESGSNIIIGTPGRLSKVIIDWNFLKWKCV